MSYKRQKGNGPRENEKELAGRGNRAYQTAMVRNTQLNIFQSQTNRINASSSYSLQQFYPLQDGYGRPISSINPNQLHRPQDPGGYRGPPTYDDFPRPDPPPISNASPSRSYAAVVSQGQSMPAAPTSAESYDTQKYQQRSTPQRHPYASAGVLAPTSVHPKQPRRGPSYAEVVANGRIPASHWNQPYTDPDNSASYGSQFTSNEYNEAPYNVPTSTNPPFEIPYDYLEQSATFVDDSWMLDPTMDLPLYDEPLTRYVEREGPFVPRGALVVNIAATLSPSQLLKSPADTADTVSMTSSARARRTKREILEGESGEFKCQHCGGGFNSSDDRRHHENRVHMPYEQRKHVCPHCNERFVYSKDAKRHMAKHEDRANAEFKCSRPHCKYATMGFTRKDHWQRHMDSHYKADSAVQMSRSTSARTFPSLR